MPKGETWLDAIRLGPTEYNDAVTTARTHIAMPNTRTFRLSCGCIWDRDRPFNANPSALTADWAYHFGGVPSYVPERSSFSVVTF